MKTLTLILACVLTITGQTPAKDTKVDTDHRESVIKSLEDQRSLLEREIARLETIESGAKLELNTAQKRLRIIRKRLRNRKVSSLTVEESARLQGAVRNVDQARARLLQSQIDLMDTRQRIGQVDHQIKLVPNK